MSQYPHDRLDSPQRRHPHPRRDRRAPRAEGRVALQVHRLRQRGQAAGEPRRGPRCAGEPRRPDVHQGHRRGPEQKDHRTGHDGPPRVLREAQGLRPARASRDAPHPRPGAEEDPRPPREALHRDPGRAGIRLHGEPPGGAARFRGPDPGKDPRRHRAPEALQGAQTLQRGPRRRRASAGKTAGPPRCRRGKHGRLAQARERNGQGHRPRRRRKRFGCPLVLVCLAAGRGERHRPGRHQGERVPQGRDQRGSADRLPAGVPLRPPSLHGQQGTQRRHAGPRQAAGHQDERVRPVSGRCAPDVQKRARGFRGAGAGLGAAGAAREHGRARGRRDGRDAVTGRDEGHSGNLPHPHDGKRRRQHARGPRRSRKENGPGVHRDHGPQRIGLLRRRSDPRGRQKAAPGH